MPGWLRPHFSFLILGSDKILIRELTDAVSAPAFTLKALMSEEEGRRVPLPQRGSEISSVLGLIFAFNAARFTLKAAGSY